MSDRHRQCSSCFFCHRDPSTTVPMSQRRTRRRRVYHLTSQEDVGAPLCMVRRQSGGAAGGLDGLQTLTSQSSMVPPLKGTILTRWQAEARSGVSPQQVKKTYDEKQFSNENPNSKGLKAFWKPSKLVLRKLSTEKGPDSSNPYSREEHRLFLSWASRGRSEIPRRLRQDREFTES